MIKILKTGIKKVVNAIGLDIVRISNSPYYSLLGLKNLPNFRRVIDVGANKGQFASHISKFFPEAIIYSFEPIPVMYQELKNLAETCMKGRLFVFNLAIGEQVGTIDMFFHTTHSPSSSFLKTTNLCEDLYPFTKEQKTSKVKITTLDCWVEDSKISLEPEILIKLDVQGYEDRVIKGGVETFKKAKACIMEVCLDKLYEGQTDFKELCMMLYDLGFCYAGNLEQTYASDGHVIYIDAVFMKQGAQP